MGGVSVVRVVGGVVFIIEVFLGMLGGAFPFLDSTAAQ